MFSLVVAFCFIASAVSQQCSLENAQRTVDSTKLKCIKGEWTPVACIMPSGQEVNDGDVQTIESYMMQCQKSGDKLKMVSIGCLKDGKLLAPTQTYVKDDVYYTCTYKGDSVVLELSGCVGPQGQQTQIGSTLDTERFSFKCVTADDTLRLISIGCRFNNVSYEFGKEVTDEFVWYTCEHSKEEGVQLIPKGCVNDGFRLFADEMFQRRGFLYKCIVSDFKVQAVGIGCLQSTEKKTIVEHLIGEKWIEGLGKTKYVVECAQDRLGMYKKPVMCHFNEGSKGVSLAPGCLKKSGKFLYECLKVDAEGLRSVQIENPTSDHLEQAEKTGLKICNFA